MDRGGKVRKGTYGHGYGGVRRRTESRGDGGEPLGVRDPERRKSGRGELTRLMETLVQRLRGRTGMMEQELHACRSPSVWWFLRRAGLAEPVDT